MDAVEMILLQASIHEDLEDFPILALNGMSKDMNSECSEDFEIIFFWMGSAKSLSIGWDWYTISAMAS